MNQAQEAKEPMIAQASDSVVVDCAPQTMNAMHIMSGAMERPRMMINDFMTGKK
jgi:hypothetical protein